MLRTFLMIASALPLVGCLNVTVVSTDGEKTPVEPSESSAPSVLPDHQTNSHWYVDEQRAVRERNADASAGRAKNIVFFLGDGMGVSTVTAARILAGQRLGGSGEEYSLSFDHFPMSGHGRKRRQCERGVQVRYRAAAPPTRPPTPPLPSRLTVAVTPTQRLRAMNRQPPQLVPPLRQILARSSLRACSDVCGQARRAMAQSA